LFELFWRRINFRRHPLPPMVPETALGPPFPLQWAKAAR
jgi:hypothetical protein